MDYNSVQGGFAGRGVVIKIGPRPLREVAGGVRGVPEIKPVGAKPKAGVH